jgi:cell division protein ZapA (FtsZ GTPase activity inhibitor)
MKRPTLRKKIANSTLQVPIYGNEKRTDELIQQVNERVKQIEEESDRIDTQAFAILAALSFAAEVRELQEARAAEGENVLRNLRKLAESIRALTRDYREL